MSGQEQCLYVQALGTESASQTIGMIQVPHGSTLAVIRKEIETDLEDCLEGDFVFVSGERHIEIRKKQEGKFTWPEKELRSGEELQMADLSDFSGVSCDEEVIRALKEGERDARELCSFAGMTSKCRWWTSVWIKEDFSKFSTGIQVAAPDETDMLQEDYSILEAEEGNDHDLQEALELRHCLDTVLDEAEEQHIDSKVDSYVCAEGKLVSKATLVSRLNGNPLLSKDRLTKVRTTIFEKEESSHTSTSMTIWSDCAVLYEDENFEGLKKWWLGRVVKMRRRVGNTWRDSREYFNLDERSENDNQVEVIFGWYQDLDGRHFKYNIQDHKVVELSSVIQLVNLTYIPDTQTYELDIEEFKGLNDFTSQFEPSRVQAKRSLSRKRRAKQNK